MQTIAWFTKWLLRAAIFFVLFAFALNNPHLVQMNLFFGQRWQAPLVLVVLVVFAAGVTVGALGMTPRWWRQRKRAQASAQAAATGQAAHGAIPSTLPASSP
jgi:uncharacterized integral membrane protein